MSAPKSKADMSWPSIPAIQARSAGLKRSAIRSSIKRLEMLGNIKRIVGGGRGRSTLYRYARRHPGENTKGQTA